MVRQAASGVSFAEARELCWPPATRQIRVMDAGIPESRAALASFADGARAELRTAARREAIASWARLAVFVAGGAGWISLGLAETAGLAWLGSAVAGFVWTVRRHLVLRERLDDAERLVQMCDESARRMGGSVVRIRDEAPPGPRGEGEPELPRIVDDGRVWPLTAQERDDLDLFAPPVGLFGLLNRTSSALGARRLRDALLNPLLERERIVARRDAVLSLAGDTSVRLHLLAACAGLRGEDRRLCEFSRAVDGARGLHVRAPVGPLRVWSIFSTVVFVSCGVAALGGATGWAWGVLGVLIVNAAIFAPLRGAVREVIRPWPETTWAVRRYARVARLAAEQLSGHAPLAEIGRAFAAVARPEVLPRLARRCAWTESAGPIQVLLNGVGLYELHVAAALNRVVAPHRSELLAGLAAIAELEMLLSLACFAAEQPCACLPRIADDVGLEIRGGRHPLIDPQRVVPNDVLLDGRRRVWIITGSNMSGKSTLLRMVGVNTLLAQIGTVAVADEMSWSPARIVTDLTVSDSLAAGESYFLAEVRHLRRLLKAEQDDSRAPAGVGGAAAGSTDTVLLGLIDEPFRGTNSVEQTAASVAVVRHLARAGCLILLATHDRELTTLADGDTVQNFHFREDLGSTGMVFDYRLHAGPATTRNALRVLEREGYDESVLRDAYEWLTRSGSS